MQISVSWTNVLYKDTMFLWWTALQISASVATLVRSAWPPFVNRTIFAASSFPVVFSVHLQTLAKEPRPRNDLMSKLSENEFFCSSTVPLFSWVSIAARSVDGTFADAVKTKETISHLSSKEWLRLTSWYSICSLFFFSNWYVHCS